MTPYLISVGFLFARNADTATPSAHLMAIPIRILLVMQYKWVSDKNQPNEEIYLICPLGEYLLIIREDWAGDHFVFKTHVGKWDRTRQCYIVLLQTDDAPEMKLLSIPCKSTGVAQLELQGWYERNVLASELILGGLNESFNDSDSVG